MQTFTATGAKDLLVLTKSMGAAGLCAQPVNPRAGDQDGSTTPSAICPLSPRSERPCSGDLQSPKHPSALPVCSSAVAASPVSIVLLPGMDGTGLLFAPFVAALGARWAVTIVSYPGAGQLQTYAALQDLAAAALPREGRMVLLGESFSGPIAIALAAAYPERVVGVVLCCTFVRHPRARLRWLRRLISMPIPLPPWPIVSAMLLGRFATMQTRLWLRDVLAGVQPAVLRARLLAVAGVDVRAQAASIEMPVLYLKAIHDLLVPATAVDEVAQCCQQLRVQSFEAPHGLLQALPEEAAAAVDAFVETIAHGESAGQQS